VFDPKFARMLGPLDVLCGVLLRRYEPGTPEFAFGCTLGVVLAAAAESEHCGDAGPLNSLVKHVAVWVKDRKLPDGRKMGDVTADLIARVSGTNN